MDHVAHLEPMRDCACIEHHESTVGVDFRCATLYKGVVNEVNTHLASDRRK
jgi:hypothetical protein